MDLGIIVRDEINTINSKSQFHQIINTRLGRMVYGLDFISFLNVGKLFYSLITI